MKYPTSLQVQRKVHSSRYCLFIIFLFFLGKSQFALAHFEHLLVRIIHISENEKGLEVHARMPFALAVLHTSWEGIDAGQTIKYVTTERDKDTWKYYVDHDYIERFPTELGEQVMASFVLTQSDIEINNGIFDGLKVSAFNSRASFNSLAKASAVFEKSVDENPVEATSIIGDPIRSNKEDTLQNTTLLSNIDDTEQTSNERLDVFDAIVNVKFIIPNASLSDSFSIQSNMGAHLPIIDKLVNITLFHVDGQTVNHTTNGRLSASYDGKVDVTEQVMNQIKSGITHIINGLDHILLVFLLVLVAINRIDIIKKTTTFTVGHSLTLTIGMLGFIPSGAWFIPFIETAIAATIVYAGISIVLGKKDNFSITKIFIIGLLHGFGFSFIIKEALLDRGAIQFLNLLSFNIGIELGQIFILALVIPVLFWMEKYWLGRPGVLRKALSIPCIAIACFWVIERSLQIVQSAGPSA